MIKIIVPILIMTWLAQFTAIAQNSPKREFRAVWVATVANIDFPSSKKLDSDSQKREWIEMLEDFKRMGLNAVVVQIRPAGDAFYPTELAPWSEYLTGRQGARPVPMYDPLEFMITETHKRGMEFHAWMNPYRASMSMDLSKIDDQHQLKKHPEWFVAYGGRYYFNPGLEEVRHHINKVVEEVITKYDVDAIHFDDYFYPYKVKNQEFPDSATFAEYGQEFSDIGDWRRYNVDELIRGLAKLIEDTKPHVKFGISPFGVWRNKDLDPVNGSDSYASITSYDDLNADVLKWMEEGWIDYIVPQLYWYIGFAPADYLTMVKWWNDRTYGKDLYIGHAAYKVGDGGRQVQWQDRDEMSRQILLNRETPNVKGSIFFSARSLKANNLNVTDTISSYFQHRALLPVNNKIYLEENKKPCLKCAKNRDNAIRLRWKYSKKDRDNPPLYYIIYRFDGRKVGDFNDANNILALTPYDANKREWEYFDRTAERKKRYTYVVRPVNKLHQEGKPSKRRRARKR